MIAVENYGAGASRRLGQIARSLLRAVYRRILPG